VYKDINESLRTKRSEIIVTLVYMLSIREEKYMKRCMELAQFAKGHTAPNPMVGAVLVHDGIIIGEGWHKEYGKAHAEVNCIDSVSADNKKLIPESTMYVNLEPCAHEGKTPACAKRLIQEKVHAVYISNVDPFEQVRGKGINILEHADIKVKEGTLKDAGLWLNRRFFCYHQQKRPYIILKWAQSYEGNLAPADKSRMQLSNTSSQQLVHKWRMEEAAIMVGYHTAMNDNPQLTARKWEGKQPLRIILDRNLQLPKTHNIYNGEAVTWIINEVEDGIVGNVTYVRLRFDGTLLQQILNKLHAAKILSLMVEGGAELLNSFMKEGLWDEARVFETTVSIEKGLAAPNMKKNERKLELAIEDDMLEVYVNQESAYPYISGMEL